MSTHIKDEDRIAMCRACTLAENMRQCKLCTFQVGLARSENKMMTKNQIVKVYQNPISGEEYEGMARLIKEVREDIGDGLSIWIVEFVDDVDAIGETYIRTINADNA